MKSWKSVRYSDEFVMTVNINVVKLSTLGLKKYRIYSRISREILDHFQRIFCQFDLYVGHQF
jgi:hypothetical protein